MPKRGQFIISLVGLMMVVACGRVTTPPPSPVENTAVAAAPTSTPSPPSPTITPTLESTLTPTPNPSPSFTPEPPATTKPSSTPRPTRTPTPSPTPTPDHFDLPTWLANPNVTVLATIIGYGYEDGTMSFLNLDTSERFDLPLPPWVRDLTWGQDDRGSYFEYEIKESIRNTVTTIAIARVYVTTGEIAYLEPPLAGSGRVDPSPNGRHQTRVTSDETITIEDTQTGQIISLEDPFRGKYPDSVDARWSPGGDLLAVVYYDFSIPFQAMGGLAIYTVEGTVYRQFEGILSVNWAPDNTYRILYGQTDADGHYIPCILTTADNTSACFSAVADWGELQGVETGGYTWSPDAGQISFIYWSDYPDLGGLCVMELIGTEITCLITEQTMGGGDESEVYDPTYVVRYQWSPDGRYLWLLIDPFGPGSDDRSYSEIATIARDGSQYQVWGSGHEAFWRPPINP